MFSGLIVKLILVKKVSFHLQDYLEFSIKLKEYKKVGLGLAWGADLNLVHNLWHMSFIWIYFWEVKTPWNLVSSGDLEWVIFWEILWLKWSALPGEIDGITRNLCLQWTSWVRESRPPSPSKVSLRKELTLISGWSNAEKGPGRLHDSVKGINFKTQH